MTTAATTKPGLLLVDDEERILRSLAMLFRGQYAVHTATDPREALAIVERERIHVVVSDQRMPQMRGADLLREVRARSPHTMRILLTGYSELEAVVASVNEGEIFRFAQKPWHSHELREAVQQAAEISAALFDAQPAPAASAQTPPGEALLVIDDDRDVFEAVQDVAGAAHQVLWAQSMDQALELLALHEVAVVVSELTIGGESVTALLKLLKAEHPEVVTIVLTPFQDVTVFIDLINQGQVYRLLPKPVRRGAFSMSIASALRHHRSLVAAPALRAAHRVERIRRSEELSVAGRVMGFLSRMRNRVSAG